MTSTSAERRLAAIVAVDVAGYSRLMGADEEGTLAALKAHQKAATPLVQSHGGRLVGTAGDGLLLEFPSVVEAVNCAVKLQAMLAERNAGIPEDKQMLYRIGINLGDVLIDGDDIFGDGVNVAARLETLAEPGGICVARTVRNQVRDKIDVAFEDLGEVEVKNIERPVKVFRVLREGESLPAAKSAKPKWVKPVATAAVLLAALLGGGAWWWQSQPDFESADQTKFAYKLPDKPSIAVLPFDNMTGNKDQDYLSDGLTENIIAVLATTPDLFVIARNSSFTYKNKPVHMQEVAERFGVRYVLEGSLQKEGDRIRVTAQLVDALNGKHIWADRFDHRVADFFTIQDEIAQKILVQLHVNLTVGDSAAGLAKIFGKDFEAYKQYLLGLQQFQTFSVQGHRNAEETTASLSKRLPENFAVLHMLGWLQWQKVALGLTKNPPETLRKAREYADKSLAFQTGKENSYTAFTLLATIDLFERKHKSAIANADRAIGLAPSNSAQTIGIAGWVKGMSGQTAEGVRLLQQTMRVEPDYAHWIPGMLNYLLIHLARYDEAKSIAEGVLSSPSDDATAHDSALLSLATIAVFENDLETARLYIERHRKSKPTSSISETARSFGYVKDKAFLKRYLDALRKAGLPDVPPADKAKFAYELPEKPSIAILPFDNLTGDPEREFLADGLTENLIATVAQSPQIFVIARNSTFIYKGRATKVQDIAEELGVRYILEGSVQGADQKLRVTAQLIDAVDGKHLWAETYDREMTPETYFNIQDEIAQAIFKELHVELTIGEMWRSIYGKADTFDEIKQLQIADVAFQRFTREGNREAAAIYTDMLARHPEDPLPHVMLAWIHWQAALYRFSPDPKKELAQARRFAERALEISPDDWGAHGVMADLALLSVDHKKALKHADRHIELSGNAVQLHIAWVLMHSGRPEDGVALARRILRTSPNHRAWSPTVLAEGLLLTGDLDEARSIFTEVLASDVEDITLHRRALSGLTVIASWRGRMADAKRHAAKLASFDGWSTLEQYSNHMYYEKDRAFVARYIEALRAAGLPEKLPSAIPEKPSIAVLPFANMSSDAEQEYFVDGMTDDLITKLANVGGLFVIARNSAFTYKGKNVNVQDVASELGVKYVLEGSVRRAGGKIRINAQLIDAKDGGHLWAEIFDRDSSDVFALQDEVTKMIVDALRVRLNPVELAGLAKKPTDNIEAYDLYLQGWAQLRVKSPETYASALIFLKKATALDPSFAKANAALAFLHWEGFQRGWLETLGVKDNGEALERVNQYLELTDSSPTPLSHLVRADMLIEIKKDNAGAVAEARRSIELDPNFADGYVGLAMQLAIAGKPDEAISMAEMAVRLDPKIPPDYHYALGVAYYVAGRYHLAAANLEHAARRNSTNIFPLILLVATYGHVGNTEKAANVLDVINVENERSGRSKLVADSAYGWPYQDTAIPQRMYEDLKLAGVPVAFNQVSNELAKRQLTPAEVKELVVPSSAKGVMVDPSGKISPFSWTMDGDYRMEFSMWGEKYISNYRFENDPVCNGIGCYNYFELTEAEIEKWHHSHMAIEHTGNIYYFTVMGKSEPKP